MNHQWPYPQYPVPPPSVPVTYPPQTLQHNSWSTQNSDAASSSNVCHQNSNLNVTLPKSVFLPVPPPSLSSSVLFPNIEMFPFNVPPPNIISTKVPPPTFCSNYLPSNIPSLPMTPSSVLVKSFPPIPNTTCPLSILSSPPLPPAIAPPLPPAIAPPLPPAIAPPLPPAIAPPLPLAIAPPLPPDLPPPVPAESPPPVSSESLSFVPVESPASVKSLPLVKNELFVTVESSPLMPAKSDFPISIKSNSLDTFSSSELPPPQSFKPSFVSFKLRNFTQPESSHPKLCESSALKQTQTTILDSMSATTMSTNLPSLPVTSHQEKSKTDLLKKNLVISPSFTLSHPAKFNVPHSRLSLQSSEQGNTTQTSRSHSDGISYGGQGDQSLSPCRNRAPLQNQSDDQKTADSIHLQEHSYCVLLNRRQDNFGTDFAFSKDDFTQHSSSIEMVHSVSSDTQHSSKHYRPSSFKKHKHSFSSKSRHHSSKEHERHSSSREYRHHLSSKEHQRHSFSKEHKHHSSSRDHKYHSPSKKHQHHSSPKEHKHHSLSKEFRHHIPSDEPSHSSSSHGLHNCFASEELQYNSGSEELQCNSVTEELIYDPIFEELQHNLVSEKLTDAVSEEYQKDSVSIGHNLLKEPKFQSAKNDLVSIYNDHDYCLLPPLNEQQVLHSFSDEVLSTPSEQNHHSPLIEQQHFASPEEERNLSIQECNNTNMAQKALSQTKENENVSSNHENHDDSCSNNICDSGISNQDMINEDPKITESATARKNDSELEDMHKKSAKLSDFHEIVHLKDGKDKLPDLNNLNDKAILSPKDKSQGKRPSSNKLSSLPKKKRSGSFERDNSLLRNVKQGQNTWVEITKSIDCDDTNRSLEKAKSHSVHRTGRSPEKAKSHSVYRTDRSPESDKSYSNRDNSRVAERIKNCSNFRGINKSSRETKSYSSHGYKSKSPERTKSYSGMSSSSERSKSYSGMSSSSERSKSYSGMSSSSERSKFSDNYRCITKPSERRKSHHDVRSPKKVHDIRSPKKVKNSHHHSFSRSRNRALSHSRQRETSRSPEKAKRDSSHCGTRSPEKPKKYSNQYSSSRSSKKIQNCNSHLDSSKLKESVNKHGSHNGTSRSPESVTSHNNSHDTNRSPESTKSYDDHHDTSNVSERSNSQNSHHDTGKSFERAKGHRSISRSQERTKSCNGHHDSKERQIENGKELNKSEKQHLSKREEQKTRCRSRNRSNTPDNLPCLSLKVYKYLCSTSAEIHYSPKEEDPKEIIANDPLKSLHEKFKYELVDRAERIRDSKPKYEPPKRKTKLRKPKPPKTDPKSGSSSSSEESSSEEEDTAMEELERKKKHPDRLHLELWFNDPKEMNDGPLCRCSAKARRAGIRHGIYVGENHLPLCEPLSNNASRLYHYRVTMTPHTNFLTKNPTTINHEGHEYRFEGFSMFSHSPLPQLPNCKVIRFNYEYTIFYAEEEFPKNFTVQGLELLTKYLLSEVLELVDLNWKAHDDPEGCPRFHFMPRFARELKDGGKELLSHSHVLEYLLKEYKILINESDLPEVLKLDNHEWQDLADEVKGMIVTCPGMKPSSIRVDQLDREQCFPSKENFPVIVHFGVRPPQLSYAGNPYYQKAWRDYVKYRHLLANKPKVKYADRHKLLQKESRLQEMRMENDLKRDVTVVISSKHFYKTGIMSDVVQHAMLLPVLVCHLRFHQSLTHLESKLGYQFQDRFLLQLALTHPSYRENFGTNPDHARNSLTNCGLRQPQYGDRRIHYMNTRKRGINTLINIMSRFGSRKETLSRINHNERLEFLGDAVVEFLSSIHLFYIFPDLEEGGLATYRAAIVQNQHLAVLSKKLELDRFMLYAHGSDLCHDLELRHAMANCFEALMGALFLDNGIEIADKVFSRTLFSELELLEVWLNFPLHPLQEQEPGGDRKWIESVPLLKKLHKFEETIGIEFNHIRLLARALTHRSLGYNNLTLGSNQRLEFLGDTVLQLVASEYLYKFFPEHHEGHLSLLRSSLVNNRTQAVVCADLGMVDYAIYPYEKMELKPKDKADLLEAFLGALYVDKDLGFCRKFCEVCFFPRLQDFIMNQDWNDPKSKLQQCCLTLRSMDGGEPDIPTYKVIECKGPTNTRVYSVAVYFQGNRLAVGSGHSIQQAEMDAADNALKKSKDLFPQLRHQRRAIERSLKKGPPNKNKNSSKDT